MKRNKSCYYCGEAATGVEHVPPLCFFPEGQREDLFTVPSFEIHNHKKSKDDEYVKTALTISANLMLKRNLSSIIHKSFRALNRNIAFRETVLKKPEPAFVVLDDGRLYESFSHEIDLPRFMSFFDSMGRALYFYHENKVWNGRTKIAPHFLLKENAEEIDLEINRELIVHFDKAHSHGKNKSIFYYNFVYVFDNEVNRNIIMYVLSVCLFDEFKISILLPVD